MSVISRVFQLYTDAAYSSVSIYLSFINYTLDLSAYTSLLASFHLLVIRINYTPTQPILVYSLVSIYLSFDQLYTDAAYTSLLASFHLLVI